MSGSASLAHVQASIAVPTAAISAGPSHPGARWPPIAGLSAGAGGAGIAGQVRLAEAQHPRGVDGWRLLASPARDQPVTDQEVEVRVGDLLRVAGAKPAVEGDGRVVAEGSDGILRPVEVDDDPADEVPLRH